jgi:hypothetical protein
VSRTFWIGLALLCVAGFLVIARRMSETKATEQFPDGEGGSGYQTTSLKDDIDWEELERAEDEVRDIDPMAKPEDGFEGDDWGPGSVPKPPLV